MPEGIRSARHRRLVEILIAAREAACLTQARLFEQFSRPQPFVAKIKNGKRRLDVIDLGKATDGEPHDAFASVLINESTTDDS